MTPCLDAMKAYRDITKLYKTIDYRQARAHGLSYARHQHRAYTRWVISQVTMTPVVNTGLLRILFQSCGRETAPYALIWNLPQFQEIEHADA
jgi:hypothetical protein